MFTNRELATIAVSTCLGAMFGLSGALLMGTSEPVRIAVIDYGKVIGSLRADTSDAERDQLLTAVDVQRRKLSSAGYLVLNGDSVLAAPAAMQVPLPVLKSGDVGTSEDHIVDGVE